MWTVASGTDVLSTTPWPKLTPVFWADKVNSKRERDAETGRLLMAAGWEVLRIWEHVPVEEAAALVEASVRTGKPKGWTHRLSLHDVVLATLAV